MLRAPCLLGAYDSVTRRTHHTLPSGEIGPTLSPRLGLTIPPTHRHIMKSYLKYLIGCLGLLLLLPACKNESDVEEATIDVSTQLMTFTKEGANRPLTGQDEQGYVDCLHHPGILGSPSHKEGNALQGQGQRQ